MKKKAAMIIMWIMAFIPLIITVILYGSLPEKVPMQFDINWNVDRYGHRSELIYACAAFLLMPLMFSVFIRNFERKAAGTDDEKAKAGYMSNIKVVTIIGIITSLILTVTYICILILMFKTISNTGSDLSFDPIKPILIMLGILFMVLGNILPKTRRNSVVGLRCSWTYYNDVTWQKSNRFAALLIIALGAFTIGMAMIMPAMIVISVMMGALFLITIVSLIYAYRVYKEEKQKGENQDV